MVGQSRVERASVSGRTYVVALELWGGGVGFGNELHGESAADDLGLAGLELGRIHGDSVKEASVRILELGETICDLCITVSKSEQPWTFRKCSRRRIPIFAISRQLSLTW